MPKHSELQRELSLIGRSDVGGSLGGPLAPVMTRPPEASVGPLPNLQERGWWGTGAKEQARETVR